MKSRNYRRVNLTAKTKVCSTCNKRKEKTENFYRMAHSGDGFRPNCKMCCQKQDAVFSDTDKRRAQKRRYNKSDEGRALQREWLEKNREYVNERKRERYHSDENIREREKLRRSIHGILKAIKSGNDYTGDEAIRYLGTTIEGFIEYMESKFKKGMSWSNWGAYTIDQTQRTWHIDHIKPLSKFDLTNKEEQLKAANYTNLQPLWAEENLSKGAKAS